LRSRIARRCTTAAQRPRRKRGGRALWVLLLAAACSKSGPPAGAIGKTGAVVNLPKDSSSAPQLGGLPNHYEVGYGGLIDGFVWVDVDEPAPTDLDRVARESTTLGHPGTIDHTPGGLTTFTEDDGGGVSYTTWLATAGGKAIRCKAHASSPDPLLFDICKSLRMRK